MAKSMISLKNINKCFGSNHVVKNLSMEIEEGEFLTILGPSGCGKTTTLRMVAGFDEPDSGEIILEGKSVQDTEPYGREVNTVFQNYALFPHMTVFENIAYGLTMKKLKKDEIAKRVSEMLQLVQLEGYDKRKPDQLSGGQKQRVAIARALVNTPKVLLLDEPLGALDQKLRKQMQFELKRLQKKLGITFIYVTHDQEEALTMSDRIAIMYKGNLEQFATPKEIYEKPATKFVADFIGESNIFYGTVGEIRGSAVSVTVEAGEFIAEAISGLMEKEIVYVSVRPENIQLKQTPEDGYSIVGIIKEHVFIGNLNKTIVEIAGGMEIKVSSLAKAELFPVGSMVNLYWNKEDAVIIKDEAQTVFDIVDNPDFSSVGSGRG